MKLVFTSSLFSATWAGFISLGDEFQKALTASKPKTGNLTFGALRNGIDFGPSLDNINGYGCWCYFDEEDHGKGKGQPVNELDRLCRVLHDGYDCIEMDDPLCQAHTIEHEVEYPPPIPNAWADEADYPDLEAKCSTANSGDECTTRACMIESYFMAELLKMYIATDFSNAQLYGAGGPLDAAYRHNNGFDPAESCMTVNVNLNGPFSGATGTGGDGGAGTNVGPPAVASGGSNTRQCCGVYPTRFPYHTEYGTRGCCGQKSYDASLLSCCSDLTIQMVCP